jgi:hypothetical protein
MNAQRSPQTPSPTPAERAALRVAQAATMTPDASYDMTSAIVFALGSAQLLQSPETAAELERLRVFAAATEQRHENIRARVAQVELGKDDAEMVGLGLDVLALLDGPVPFVLTERAEAELRPAVVTTYADQASARLRRLGHPLDRGVRS